MERFQPSEFSWTDSKGNLVDVDQLTVDELQQALCFCLNHMEEMEDFLVNQVRALGQKWRDPGNSA